MPRIRPRDIWQARNINKALLALLPVCRDLEGARNELRWLKQHAVAVSQQIGQSRQPSLLTDFIDRRARGEPLQYVLGSDYFGELEIRCRPSVLIPRCDSIKEYVDSDHSLIQEHVDRRQQRLHHTSHILSRLNGGRSPQRKSLFEYLTSAQAVAASHSYSTMSSTPMSKITPSSSKW